MKYSITQYGGFGGLVRTYTGEVALEEAAQAELFRAMDGQSAGVRENLRDALHYDIQLEDQGEHCTAYFSEFDIPGVVKSFLEQVLKN